MNLSDYRMNLERKKAVKNDIELKLEKQKTILNKQERFLKKSEKALWHIQEVAFKTQSELEYKISEIATLALEAVFPNPYKVRLQYDIKRNKTEARLLFERGTYLVNPMDDAGGGAVDVASFALRLALWSLAAKRTDNLIILDEPFKNLNDETRKLHKKAGLMLKEISSKLELQIIMISLIPEVTDIADRTFKIKLEEKGKWLQSKVGVI